jgi:hypothetical protein
MAIEYTDLFNSEALLNLPKFGNFGLKVNHLATLAYIAIKKIARIECTSFSQIGVMDDKNFKSKKMAILTFCFAFKLFCGRNFAKNEKKILICSRLTDTSDYLLKWT